MHFKSDKTRFIVTPLFVNGVIILIGLNYQVSIIVPIIITVCVNWVYFTHYLQKFLSEIKINVDSNICSLTYINNFTHKERVDYPLNELKCGFLKITKARGIQVEVFRILFNELVVVEVTPSDGWSYDTCVKIQKQLEIFNDFK